MAKVIEYDVSGVEESSGGTGVKVPIGVKPARIALVEHRSTKKDGSKVNDIRVGLDFGAAYDWIFTYIGLGEESDWKLAEFIRALDLKDKGKLNLEKIKDKIIRVRVVSDTYEGEYSPRAGRLMKAQDGDEDIIGESVSERSSADGPDDEPQDDEAAQGGGPHAGEKKYDDPEFVASRENVDGSGPYDDWEDADLEAECADRGVTVPGGRGKKRDKFIAALRAEDEEVLGGSPAADEDDDDNDTTDDYDTWELDALKKEWTDRNLDDMPNIRGKGAADRMKTALIEGLRQDDEENPFEG